MEYSKIGDSMEKEILKNIDFKKGLVPAVIQDFQNGEVLMVAYMNEESLNKT